MKKKYLLFILLVISVVPKVHAQYWDKEESGRFFVGGSLGLLFGTVTQIEVSPMGGVNLTPRFNTGLSFVYNYINNTRFNNYKTSIFGGRAFSEFVILKDIAEAVPIGFLDNIYAHAEYELLRFEAEYYNLVSNNSSNSQQFIESVNAGIGFGMPLGGNNTLKISFLYNINENPYYIYQNPVVRVDLSIYLKQSLPKRYKKGMD